jgi:hypothetical protein
MPSVEHSWMSSLKGCDLKADTRQTRLAPLPRNSHRQGIAVLMVGFPFAAAGCDAGPAHSSRPVVTGGDLKLHDVGPPSAWSSEQLSAQRDSGYGSRLLGTTDQGGSSGLEGLVRLLREAAVRIVDAQQRNRTVVDTPAPSHAMYVQAGQVVAIASERSQHGMLPLGGLVNMVIDGVVAEYPQADPGNLEVAIREFWSDALSDPSTPDERAWAAIVTTLDKPRSVPPLATKAAPTATTIIDALKGPLCGRRRAGSESPDLCDAKLAGPAYPRHPVARPNKSFI